MQDLVRLEGLPDNSTYTDAACSKHHPQQVKIENTRAHIIVVFMTVPFSFLQNSLVDVERKMWGSRVISFQLKDK